MNGGKRPLGYTIVEVLIVLAVSSLMFVLAANFVSGKQAKTAFTAGVDEMAARVQDVIDQVTDGRYSDRRFTCTAGVSGLEFDTITTATSTTNKASSDQGRNPQCVFIGKFLHFNGQGDKITNYELFSLAGRRLKSDHKPAVTLNEAEVAPIIGDGIDLTVNLSIPQQVEFRGAIIGGAKRYGFGFVQGLGKLDSGDAQNNTYSSGAQTPSLVTVPAMVTAGESKDSAAARIKGADITLADKVTMCLSDGTRFANIIIGDNQNRLSVRVQRLNDAQWAAVGCS